MNENECKNIYDGAFVDGFVCSECGFHIEGFTEVESDHFEYTDGVLYIDDDYKECYIKYCPNCGRKVVNWNEY